MWFWQALASAFLVGLSIVIGKKLLSNVGTVLVTWSLFTLSIPLLAVIAFSNGIPKIEPLFYLGVCGSGMVFVFAKLIEMRSIKERSFHLVYPLTVFSTVFTYILGVFVFQEYISTLAIIGMTVTLVGAYILNVEKTKEGVFEPFMYLLKDKFSLLLLFAMFLTAISSIFDKVALLHVQGSNPSITLVFENIIMSSFLVAVLTKRNRQWMTQVKKYFWWLLLMAVLYALGGIFTFQAFVGGTVALTSAVKRTQVLWVMLYGVLFFHERPPKHAWIATILMISGVILLRLG